MRGQCLKCGEIFKDENDAKDHAAYSQSCGIITLVDESETAGKEALLFRKKIQEEKKT